MQLATSRVAALFGLASTVVACLGTPSANGGNNVDASTASDVAPAEESMGASVVVEAPQAEDAGPIAPKSACTALGSLTIASGTSTIGRYTGGAWNRFIVQVTSTTLGAGTHALWAFDLQAHLRRVGATIRIEDNPANAAFSGGSEALLMTLRCPANGGLTTCGRLFQATRGLARFDALATASGDRFQGFYSNVEFHEVRIDPTTLRTTPTESTECYSLDLFAFNSLGEPLAPTNPTDAGTPDPCADNATCGTCTPVDGCGWCSNTQRCVSGTQTGPADSTCAGTQWSWFASMCPGPADAGTPDAGTPSTRSTDAGGLGGSGSGNVSGSGFRLGSGEQSWYGACVTGTSSCTPQVCLRGTGQTAGVCSSSCTTDASCEAGGVCMAFSSPYCLRPCPSSGCGTGLHCAAYRTVSGRAQAVCVPSYW